VCAVLLILFIFGNEIHTGTSQAEYYDLSPSEILTLKDDVSIRKNPKSAWKLFDYYELTKNDHQEAVKWERIANALESTNNKK